MDSYAVDLLECYLRDHPNLKRSILLNPPRLQWRGRWRRIARCQFRVAWSEPGGHLCHFDAECPRVFVTETLADFASHFGRVCRYRTFPPPNPRHFFYRYRQERWLESLVIRGHRLFNDRFREVIYSQVPSYLDGQRKVLDLLTVTDSGRLAVLDRVEDRKEPGSHLPGPGLLGEGSSAPEAGRVSRGGLLQGNPPIRRVPAPVSGVPAVRVPQDDADHQEISEAGDGNSMCGGQCGLEEGVESVASICSLGSQTVS